MTKCTKCKTPMPSKLVFKSYWSGYKSFACENCETQFEFTLKSRIIGGMVIGISVFLSWLLMNFTELESGLKTILGLLSLVVFSFVISALSLTFLTFEKTEKINSSQS